MSIKTKNQSNPFSTGGGGVNFETRVQAAFIAVMLTRSCVPCMDAEMRAFELKFQSKYDGADTDDFVLSTADQNGNTATLYAQIKHEITITANSTMFAEVIKSGWSDFNKPDFNVENDVIALITGPLPKNDVNNVLPILEWAKHSASAEEFLKKANKKGFTSKSKIEKLNAIRSQLIAANEGKAVTDNDFWQFLKVYKLISYDLDAKDSTVASLLCAMLEDKSAHPPSLVLAKIITCVQGFNQNAGTISLDNVPTEIKSLFDNITHKSCGADIRKFKERGEFIFGGINNTVADVHIQRPDYLVELFEKTNEADFVFVTGQRGCGKSGIVKDFVMDKAKDIPVFYVRTEDLDKNHLNDVFASFGMRSPIRQIEAYFALIPEKILVIESLEKVLELNLDNAFLDLLQLLTKQTGWTVIATGRDYAFQQLTFNYLQPRGISYESITVTGFNSKQLAFLCEEIPAIRNLIKDDSLTELLHTPFFLDLAVRAMQQGAVFDIGDGEKEFRKVIWDVVIANHADRKGGMPAKRKATFIEIAKNRAKQMLFGIPDIQFDAEVIAKLEEDHLIHRDSEKSLVSPIHDVLEDWALEAFIQSQYLQHQMAINVFLSSIGDEPALNRAFRLWLFQRLKYGEDVTDFITTLLAADEVSGYWKDETIAAILQSDSPGRFLELLTTQLLKNNCALLVRFCFILRMTCQRPHSLNAEAGGNGSATIVDTLYLQPYGAGWAALIAFIHHHRKNIAEVNYPHIIGLLDDWCRLINIHEELPEAADRVGLIALWQLDYYKDAYDADEKIERIINILLQVATEIQVEFDALMARDVFTTQKKSRRLHYVDKLVNLATVGVNVPMLCKRLPSFVIKLAFHEWIKEKVEEDDGGFRGFQSTSLELEEEFGLESRLGFDPASGLKGPFKYLLHFHAKEGLDFILELCNLAATHYAASEFAKPRSNEADGPYAGEAVVQTIEIKLNDESIVHQYASPHLWKGYRGLSTLPDVLQCALMALENWLIEIIENTDDSAQIFRLFDYILRSSNSAMTTAVLASVATGFPSKVGKSSFAILESPSLFYLDLERETKEMGGSTPHFFFNTDPMEKLYIEERKVAALRPWRKESLEKLLIRLQFNADCQDGAFKIIEHLTNIAKQTNEQSLRFMLHRIDTREWVATEDKENNRVVMQSNAELPEDLKEVQESFNTEHSHDNEITALSIWAQELFSKNSLNKKYFATRKEALSVAMALEEKLRNNQVAHFAEMAIGAVTRTAAIILRDCKAELVEAEVEWCIELVCEAVLVHADIRDSTVANDVTDYYGSAACAYVLPILFDYVKNEEEEVQLKCIIATALTHENSNVSDHAAKGVRDFLWQKDPEFAQYCLSGMLEYAMFRKREWQARTVHHLTDEEYKKAALNWQELIDGFRAQLVNGEFDFNVDDISLSTHLSWFIHIPMLLVPVGSTAPSYTSLIKKMIGLLCKNEYRDHSVNSNERIDYQIGKKIQDCFVEHLVASKKADLNLYESVLVEGCHSAPQLVYSIKLGFDSVMENAGDFDSIWHLWSVLAPAVQELALEDSIKGYKKNRDKVTLIKGMLIADYPLKGLDSERDHIERGRAPIIAFASKAGGNVHVFESLAYLMYNFPEDFFEPGIYILADFFKSAGSENINRSSNTAFYLERAIQGYLQVENGGALSRKMYESCITLLSGLVETASARAYYLREHLIRSRKIAV